MTENEALQWLAYATRQPIDQVLEWDLAPWQIAAVGAALAANPLINPPSRCPVKVREFVCACCGQTFEAQYRTKRPRYCGRACKARAQRQRDSARHWQAVEAARPRAVALVRNGRGFKVLHRDTKTPYMGGNAKGKPNMWTQAPKTGL